MIREKFWHPACFETSQGRYRNRVGGWLRLAAAGSPLWATARFTTSNTIHLTVDVWKLFPVHHTIPVGDLTTTTHFPGRPRLAAAVNACSQPKYEGNVTPNTSGGFLVGTCSFVCIGRALWIRSKLIQLLLQI